MEWAWPVPHSNAIQCDHQALHQSRHSINYGPKDGQQIYFNEQEKFRISDCVSQTKRHIVAALNIGHTVPWTVAVTWNNAQNTKLRKAQYIKLPDTPTPSPKTTKRKSLCVRRTEVVSQNKNRIKGLALCPQNVQHSLLQHQYKQTNRPYIFGKYSFWFEDARSKYSSTAYGTLKTEKTHTTIKT